MHVVIIGLGVGKAHALSAAKFLDENYPTSGFITLVDSSQSALRNFNWENSWGPIHDSYVPKKTRFVLTTEIPNNGDLYIIATPNDTHKTLLQLLRGKLVICEKPISFSGDNITVDELWDSVHFGVEWVYHPKLPNKECLENIDISLIIGFPNVELNESTKFHHIHDLGSHVLTVAEVVGANLGNISNHSSFWHWRNETELFSLDGIPTRLKFSYDELVPDDLFYINGVRLEWIPFEEGDLFYRQIKYVTGNPLHPKISKSTIVKVQDILNRLIDK